MDDLPLTQKSNHVIYVGIVREPENVIVGGTRLLFGGKVLGEIGDHIAADADADGIPRHARRGLRKYAERMIDEVSVKALRLDLLRRQIPCELVDDRADHFQMPEFFRADVGKDPLDFIARHGKALAQIAKRRPQFAVRSAVLGDDDLGKRRVRIGNSDRILKILLINKHTSTLRAAAVFPRPGTFQPGIRFRVEKIAFGDRPIELCIALRAFLGKPEQILIGSKRLRVAGVRVEIQGKIVRGKIDRHELGKRNVRRGVVDHVPERQIESREKRAACKRFVRLILRLRVFLRRDECSCQRRTGR